MVWDQDKLKLFIKDNLSDCQIILVSHREPYMHIYRGGEVQTIMPASGMAIALDSLMQSCGGTWVAVGSGEADRGTVSHGDALMVPPQDPKYTLRRVWLTRQEERDYYYGFANSALWPLCHVAYSRPSFDTGQWETYKSVNRKFADVILSEVIDLQRTIVFIQDYHFALLPQMLKAAEPSLLVSQFWHIPWLNYEIFRICPWGPEILGGLLGNDLLGFHLHYHCNNFCDTVDRTLGARVDLERFSICHQERETRVRPFPISIDFGRFETWAQSPQTERRVQELRHNLSLSGLKVGLGVDRLDYTKGIPERFEAIDTFFRKYPHYQQRFTFIQLGPPSRFQIESYKQLNALIDSWEEEINAKYGQGRWKPVIVLKGHYSQEEVVAFYRLADVMVISALHDGMNLVAKEYVASQVNDEGALLLSPFTGAAQELTGAYSINPYNPEETADVIFQALEDPPEEKSARMAAMRAWVREHNIFQWSARFLQALMELSQGDEQAPLTQ
jgi:trehalose-6-phosphate synthase